MSCTLPYCIFRYLDYLFQTFTSVLTLVCFLSGYQIQMGLLNAKDYDDVDENATIEKN